MFVSCRLLFALAATTVLFLHLPGAARAQDETREKVQIPTVDGVDLHGSFYRCTDPKVKNPPTILMIHPIGESSSKKGWVALAETLQKNAAVFTFDLRGHGLSTEVTPASFWKFPLNTKGIKDGFKSASKSATTIEYKQFVKESYYPVLINDIAACKAYLDRKNNTGACNTSKFIVLGAETGATLGAIWVASEWNRYYAIQNPNTLLLAVSPDTEPEGKDIIACVWISASSKLGTRNVALATTLDIPLKQRATPMVFMHGDEDKAGAATAINALKFMSAKDKKTKYAFTDRVEIKKAGNLTGIALLQKSLGVDEAISAYLFGEDGVVSANRKEWVERETTKAVYAWRMGANAFAPLMRATPVGGNAKNLEFDSYVRFIK